MKATIESTDRLVEIMDPQGRKALARVWEGVSEGGVPFTAYITCVQVAKTADNSVFERELTENKAPSLDTIRAIDIRFIV